MSTSALRQQLHEQVDNLPDDVLRAVADFARFVLARQENRNLYADWNDASWREFSLQHFFRDGAGEYDYSLADAEEIFEK